MTKLSIEDRDMLHSLSWYMSARQTALRAAVSFRAPLSAVDLTDIRVHYSGYFLNLLAAIDLILEQTWLNPNNFKAQLCSRLVFDGYQDGDANCSFIRELRNAVVHRGLNITSAVHFDGTFPMFLVEPKVQNSKQTKTFIAFGEYLLDVIEKCESVVGAVMLDCLNAAGIFETTIDAEAAIAEQSEAVKQSHVIPNHVKAMALATPFRREWAVAAHSSAMEKLHAALMPCNVAKPSAY